MRVRDLRVGKRYRDTIKKWGEPNILRKRTIIAPPMCEASEKDVTVRPCEKSGQSREESSNLSRQIGSLLEELKIDGK